MNRYQNVEKTVKNETGLRMTLPPQQMNLMHHQITIMNLTFLIDQLMEPFELYFNEVRYRCVAK